MCVCVCVCVCVYVCAASSTRFARCGYQCIRITALSLVPLIQTNEALIMELYSSLPPLLALLEPLHLFPRQSVVSNCDTPAHSPMQRFAARYSYRFQAVANVESTNLHLPIRIPFQAIEYCSTQLVIYLYNK
jgi:hypothetical protein